ncbi:MAG: D-tyrosyl-tRNA(Tyr) deacylase [Bacteroidetes bacterium]|nr:D-tyrosyl-tRNA(Tyr) deacylase [Bacteroidota bacterium]MBL0097049.1 D-tyrosyl-tRNA(Tyr) deacylase [Bacteroidota bacterium]
MRVVIQRTTHSSVVINAVEKRICGAGMLILLGIELNDNEEDIEWLCPKIVKLRIFADENGTMNKSIQECDGDILLISQFTLHASTKKGNRPSYINAARPEQAIPLYEKFIASLEKELGKKITTGEFGADMKVELINDGPVTILIDSKNRE